MNDVDSTGVARRQLGPAAVLAVARLVVARATWQAEGAIDVSRMAVYEALVRAGVGRWRAVLSLPCARGADASGLFSEAAAVLGCAQFVEARPYLYTGLRVDFGRDGLYYDPAAGPNWWGYYFEPSGPAPDPGERVRPVSMWRHDAFAEATEGAMPRTTAADLARRHMRVRPALREAVDQYWREHAGDGPVIGIHYRSTDKWEGARPVPHAAVTAMVSQMLGAPGMDGAKVYVATDELAFLEHATRTFPGRVLCRAITRSANGAPLHKAPGSGFQKGWDAVMDCLLLARCARLVRTESNLGLFAGFFNPDIGVTLLTSPA